MRRKIRVLFIVSSTILKDCKSNNVLFTFSIYTEESTEATSVSRGGKSTRCAGDGRQWLTVLLARN